MPYVGRTPLGQLATSQLVKDYKDYVINQQTMGMPAINYEEWIKTQQAMPQSGLNPAQQSQMLSTPKY